MQDLRLALEGAFEPADRLIAPLPGRRWPRHALPVAAATFVAGVLIAGTAAWMIAPQTPATVSRFRYVLAPDQTLRRSGNLPMAVSPDGRSFVYNTTQGVFVRTIGELDARLISGTQEDLANVEFSPDGRFISFVSATGELKRIAISGGVAVRIASVASARGIHWAADGTILLAQPEGIVQVSSNGGKPTLVIPAVEREQLRAPQLLPDVRTVLFTTGTDSVRSVVAQSISSSERTIVVAEGDWARYVPPNYLVYTLRGTLFGVTFDPRTLRVTGPAMPIQQGVPLPGGYAVSPNGTLAYISGASVSRGTPVVVDRKGTIVQRLSPTPLDAPRHPAFDPTGQRIAIVVGPRGRSRLWLYSLDGRPPVPATSVGDGDVPVWSPTADRLALGYSNEGRRFVYFIPANGIAGPPEPFFAAPDDVNPQAWSPDGREIVIMRRLGRPVQTDLLAVSVDSSEKVRLLAASQKINEYHGRLSPNGRWLAHGVWYEGIGSLEIYVRPYSSDGRSIRVAADNGNFPLWSRDGTELFYVRGGQMMSIPVSTTGPEFSFGSPTLLFEGKFQFASFLPAEPDRSNPHTYYDVDPKGRFVLIEPEADPLTNEIIVVLNWQEELKRLLSTN
jgi:Tol biopolymer transport system component